MRTRLQWLVVAVICLLLLIALYPTYVHIRETRDLQVCENNMRKIAKALIMYMGDWDDTLPPGSTWMTGAAGFLTSTTGTGFSVETYFHCPKDSSGSPSSYCYNDLLEGINPKVKYRDDDKKDERRSFVRNPDRFPLIFEKHGSQANAHVRLDDYDALLQNLTRAHAMPEPTGVIITGSGSVIRRNDEQMVNLKGRKF